MTGLGTDCGYRAIFGGIVGGGKDSEGFGGIGGGGDGINAIVIGFRGKGGGGGLGRCTIEPVVYDWV